MHEPDPLWNLKNSFYLGAYQNAVNEATNLMGLADAQVLERDFFVYRSYISLGQSELVISEIEDTSPTPLVAVKLYAQYVTDKSKKESVLQRVGEWMSDAAVSSNPFISLIAGTIYAQEGNYVEALKACHTGSTLDMLGLCVQVYILMNRSDKAEQQVQAMSKIDDDSSLTQLATAWLNIALGGAKVQDAFYIYQELGEKFKWTSLLHNGSGICNLKMGRYEEAERDLLDALNKDAQDAHALANIITCQLHLGKPVTRYSSQLKMIDPNHILVRMQAEAEEKFQRAASSYV